MNDPTAPRPGPGREEVATRWRALVAGELTREAVHAWAAPWVEAEAAPPVPPLVFGALQHLHGFDLCRDPRRPGVVRHGSAGEGEWVHSAEEIRGEFARWLEGCRLGEANPEGRPGGDRRLPPGRHATG